MRIGVCRDPGGVSGPVPGLDFLDAGVASVLCPRADEEAFAAAAEQTRKSPVPVEALHGFLPGDLKTTGPAVDVRAVDEYVTTACRRAGELGVRIIVFGSGGSRSVPEGFDSDAGREQLVGHLTRWGPIAAAHDVTIVLEPLNSKENNIVNSVGEGAGMVRRVKHPNIRLLCDTYHMAVDGEGPEAILAAGELLAHVHCAERDGRGPLGAVGEDQRPYFRALRQVGYDGTVALECNWKDFDAQLPAAVAELRRQIDTAGRVRA